MLNSILSVLVSCALLLGSGAVPAIPETAARTTVENIVISCGDESVSLDHGIQYAEAIGREESAFEFTITKDGESILPVKAKITPEELQFAISENGSAYSVSGDFAAGYLYLYEEDIEMLNTAARAIKSISEIFPANSHMAFAEEIYSVIEAQEAAVKTNGTFEFAGESISGEKIDLLVGNGADFAFADAMRESETEHLSALMQLLLDLTNITEESEYASFAEMGTIEDGGDQYTVLKGETGEGQAAYYLSVGSSDDEAGMSVIFTPAVFSASVDFIGEDGSEDRLEYSCELENGEIIAASFIYDYSDSVDGDYAYETNCFIQYDYSASNGLAEQNFTCKSNSVYSLSSDGELIYSYGDDLDVAVSANDRADENGGIVTHVAAEITDKYSYDGSNPTNIAVNIAFDVRTEEEPYQDAFAAADIEEITGEDDIPARLMGEMMVFTSQLSLLQYDEKLNEVMAMIESSLEDYTEGYFIEESEAAINAEEVITDAAEAETAAEESLYPEFTPPEGYIWTDASQKANSIMKEYSNDEGNRIIYCASTDSDGYVDVQLSEGESGMPVKLFYNEEGLVYGADFVQNGFFINIYAEKGVSFELMEEMISGIEY